RVVLLAWLVQYLPWIFIARALFIFYMTPIAPFMMIGLARGLGRVRELGRPARVAVIVYLVLGVGLALVWWYPVMAAVPLPYKSWLARMFLQRSWI
ncbi:MAG: phospholipid carrier-dependent glycosyltransferase, partial [Acidimicrobiia bacterium]